jgi:hypothetical protein
MRAVAAVLLERQTAAVRALETCRREGFLPGFAAALRREDIGSTAAARAPMPSQADRYASSPRA